jgi:hypothetical protein
MSLVHDQRRVEVDVFVRNHFCDTLPAQDGATVVLGL